MFRKPSWIAPLKITWQILGCLLILESLVRLLFWSWNRDLFPPETGILPWLWGLRLDLSALIVSNMPLWIFLFLSQQLPVKRWPIRGARWSLLVINGANLGLALIDTGYFRFVRHRSNSDLLFVWADSAGAFPSILARHAWLLLVFLSLLACLIFLSHRFLRRGPPEENRPSLVAGQILTCLMLLLGARGWQATVLMPASPLIDLDPRLLPLAQNSSDDLLYSLLRRQDEIRPPHFYSDSALYSLVRSYSRIGSGHRGPMTKKNVVVCILESFCGQYLRPGDPLKAETPFFDSLMRESLCFPNAYANGVSSNQGLVAILGGLPPLLDEPFYYSPYANTPLRGLGNILRDQGYDGNFFLGASADHFGFGKLCHMAGIYHYYGRREFHDDRFYDGNWGIFDEPFLQYVSRVLDAKPQPFLAVIFNITSHYPYTIPENLRDRFSQPGKSPAQRSASYVDYAFRRFWDSCRRSAWFDHTVFLFCADHWLYPGVPGAYNSVSSTRIPLFIFDPSKKSGGTNSRIASQVDVGPTLLDWLHYSGDCTGFGNSLLDTAANRQYAINKPGTFLQIIDSDYVLGYDPVRDKSIYLYRYGTDSLFRQNLLGEDNCRRIRDRLETNIRSTVQSYDEALTRGKLH
jgi:hypothetical protein